MCTALSIKSENNKYFFGRNMDLDYDFNQSVITVPKNGEKRAVIGMGTIIDGHIVFADAMNESGLAVAGLNFTGYAHFEKSGNVPSYDFITWVLYNFDSVEDVSKKIKDVVITDKTINEKTPAPALHWIITDKTGETITVEKTKDSFKVYKNPVYVLTNNPDFEWHLTNLNEYLHLNPKPGEKSLWCENKLVPLGAGSGTLGMPGDFSSVSRFVRIAYLRANLPHIKECEAVHQLFNMLDYVKMVKGGIITESGKWDITRYSSCMDLENAVYYYKTYNNSRINAVKLKEETEIKIFPFLDKPDYNFVNYF